MLTLPWLQWMSKGWFRRSSTTRRIDSIVAIGMASFFVPFMLKMACLIPFR
jgi:hypothetical protein